VLTENEEIEMIKFLPLMALPILLASGLVQAGGANSPYVGGAVAYNTAVSDNKLSNTCSTAGVTCTDLGHTKEAWSVYGGYPITNTFSVEAGYTDLAYVARLEQANNGTVTARAGQKTKGITLGLTGKKPVTRKLDVYGKAGAFVWKSKVLSTVGNVSDSGTSPTVGLGVEYAISKKVSLRAGWDRYFKVGKRDNLLNSGVAGSVKDDIDTYSVGLSYNF
jgi:opacity protein-like surface antigen